MLKSLLIPLYDYKENMLQIKGMFNFYYYPAAKLFFFILMHNIRPMPSARDHPKETDHHMPC
jgi:hypothetical protein